MATEKNGSILNEIFSLLSAGGLDNLTQVLQTLLNQTMLLFVMPLPSA